MAGVLRSHATFAYSLCHFSGPGFQVSDFESNRIIGNMQFEAARTIMNGELSPVAGAVKSVHAYMNMSVPILHSDSFPISCYKSNALFSRAFREFKLPNGTSVSTCPAALGANCFPRLVHVFKLNSVPGFSFAGGTT